MSPTGHKQTPISEVSSHRRPVSRPGGGSRSYRKPRLAVALEPAITILLPPAHSHLVLDHAQRIVPGRTQSLVISHGSFCLRMTARLSTGSGEDQVKGGRHILIQAVNFNDFLEIALQIMPITEEVEA